MHKLALLAGKSALVIKEAVIKEEGPLYVRIVGRKSGLIAWILTHLGVDSKTTLEVYENRVEFTEGSFSGQIKQMIPLSAVSNLGAGYLKPILLIVLAVFALFSGFGIIGDSFTGAFILFAISAVCTFLYFIRKSMLLSVIPGSGQGALIIFKRSLIENVNMTEEDTYKVIDLITKLIEKNKKV